MTPATPSAFGSRTRTHLEHAAASSLTLATDSLSMESLGTAPATPQPLRPPELKLKLPPTALHHWKPGKTVNSGSPTNTSNPPTAPSTTTSGNSKTPPTSPLSPPLSAACSSVSPTTPHTPSTVNIKIFGSSLQETSGLYTTIHPLLNLGNKTNHNPSYSYLNPRNFTAFNSQTPTPHSYAAFAIHQVLYSLLSGGIEPNGRFTPTDTTLLATSALFEEIPFPARSSSDIVSSTQKPILNLREALEALHLTSL